MNAPFCPGVKNGETHEIERQSALIFIGFVFILSNVMFLLIHFHLSLRSGLRLYLWLCIDSLTIMIHYAHGLVRILLLLRFYREQVVFLHLPAQFNAIILPFWLITLQY